MNASTRQLLLVAAATLALAGTPSANAFFGLRHQVDLSSGVSQVDANTWQYSYTVTNLSECVGNCSDTVGGQPIDTSGLVINRFDLPYFGDYGTLPIETATSPTGWTATLLSGTPFVNEDGSTLLNSMTLRWTASNGNPGLAIGDSLGGFGYKAGFGAGYAPYKVGFPDSTTVYGDPPIPLSAAAQAAGIQPLAAVPEPQAWLLMAIGLAGLGLRSAKRRRSLAKG